MFSSNTSQVSSSAANYIEDVFSTWLYTGTGATQTITNGIDLAGKGGLVWIKRRNAATSHSLWRAPNLVLTSSGTDAEINSNGTGGVTAYNSDGFSLAAANIYGENNSGAPFASWTFREQPKFFDVVTWTGDASGNRTLSHTLASTPGCIIIKATNAVDDWYVYHTSLGTGKWLYLNTTSAEQTGSIVTAVSSTTFTVSQSNGFNTNGRTYVAYLFAHNAGGFGLSGTDNVITCGSFAANANTTVNLGYEPQWILFKNAQGTNNWGLVDNMRGWTADGNINVLAPNLANGETTENSVIRPTATGFQWLPAVSGNTYIYIAIRRGPMKTPTSGTQVFDPETATASTGTSRTIGFPADMSFGKARTITASNLINDRLRGYANSNTTAPSLFTNTTSAEDPSTTLANVYNVWNTTALDGAYFNNFSTVWYHFRRAPGFFDEVCYTGSPAQLTLNHNLGVVPEMIITKARNNPDNWYVWCQYNSSIAEGACISLNSNASTASAGGGSLSSFTASSFNTFLPGINGWTAVSYLFASCPGVSKVGSYTGTGATQVINCGFTTGARFVLIKATSTTGDWLVWDSARGIVAGNDPYLALNSTAAEVTNTDWVDTAASGFELSNAAGNLANSNGVSYIYLAIA